MSPCAIRSASRAASFPSVLRPGAFCTGAALASAGSNSPSDRMGHTGFQETPVASITIGVASLRRQPRRQGHAVRRRRLKRPRLSAHIAVAGVAGAGHDAILVDIQSGAIGVQNFPVPSTTAAGLEPRLKKSNKRAPGPSPDHGAIWGAQGFPVRPIDGLAHTKGDTDLTADGAPAYPTIARFISCGSRTSVAG